jgi:hypothetical protein
VASPWTVEETGLMGRMTKASSCDVCGKPTSRLFGFAAVIVLEEGGEDASALTPR